MKYLRQFIVTGIIVSCLGISPPASATQLRQSTRANLYQSNNYYAYRNHFKLLDIVTGYERNLSCTTSRLGFNPLSDRYQI